MEKVRNHLNKVLHLENKDSKTFITILSFTLIIGLMMIYSSSYIYAKELYQNPNYFISRQLIFLTIGIFTFILTANIKFDFMYKHAFKINCFVTFLVSLTIVPDLGKSIKGASRWLDMGIISIQPGELLKVSIILATLKFFENLSEVLNEKEAYLGNDKESLFNIILQFISLLIPLAFLIKQPDFGTFAICSFIIIYSAFLSEIPKKYFWTAISFVLAIIMITLISEPYRIQRLLTFLDPWKNAQTTGFQIIQSYLAFANGHIWGLGIGNSNEKLFYLPEAHNDFILSVVGEEFGFVGVLVIISLFFSLIIYGYKVALISQKRINTIFISIIIFSIGLQAFTNMGVVLGVLPTKGLNLPFISYGGSSLISNLIGLGMVYSALKVDKKTRSFL